MQVVRRFRIPAVCCALSVLVCELISRPYANMGICDDWSYILTAQKFAATGHIVYVGWAAAMLGWQACIGAVFIKIFGFSLTAVRMSTLVVAMVLAFFLQRIMVRANISERNATIGTLALVLSPLYLMLSVTFMTDVHGLFAIVLCLYGCLRALQAATARGAISWLIFAVVTNAICGTSRQIAWLGILVMVPCALYLLRGQRRVVIAGAAATLAGALFSFGCMRWFRMQPYSTPQDLIVAAFPVTRVLSEFILFFLDIPFLLLPIVVLFLPEIRKLRPSVKSILTILVVGYFVFLASFPRIHGSFKMLALRIVEPTKNDWVTASGGYGVLPNGQPPLFLHPVVLLLLTVASYGGLIGLIATFFRSRGMPRAVAPSAGVSWKQLGILLAPFTIVYTLLLVLRAVTKYGLFDRYALWLLIVGLICLVRFYQDRIQLRLPFFSILLVGMMAIYGIIVTHNMFAFYRARATIAADLRAAGIPDTSVDYGWEYNIWAELQHADHINDANIVVPANAYVPTPPPPSGICSMLWYDFTPHIRPIYGISFDPNACYGPAPFAPVNYSRWFAAKQGTLYVVSYTATSKR